jgi:hypothetical protein
MNEISKNQQSQTKTLWIIVLLIHVSFLLFLPSAEIKSKTKPKKMLVSTRVLEEKRSELPTKIKEISEVLEKKKENFIQTKPIRPIKTLKKEKPKALVGAKEIKKKPVASKEVLKKIDKRLKKPESSLKKKQAPTMPKETITPKETILNDYIEKASIIFKEELFLPEKGLVKLTITVLTNGKIDKIEIETFESKKNLRYLMEVLPTLTMPTYEKGFDATFTVLFCSD